MTKVRIVIQKPRVEAFRTLVEKCRADHRASVAITKEEPGHHVPAANYYPVIFSLEGDDVREIFHLGVEWGKELKALEASDLNG